MGILPVSVCSLLDEENNSEVIFRNDLHPII